jgi:hypothetical protein
VLPSLNPEPRFLNPELRTCFPFNPACSTTGHPEPRPSQSPLTERGATGASSIVVFRVGQINCGVAQLRDFAVPGCLHNPRPRRRFGYPPEFFCAGSDP